MSCAADPASTGKAESVAAVSSSPSPGDVSEHRPATDGPSPTTGRLDIVLGDVTLCLHSSDRRWLEQAAQRYGAFAAPAVTSGVADGASEATATWRVDYEVCGHRTPTPDTLRRARQHGLHLRGDGPRRAVIGHDFRGLWLADERRIEVAGPRAIYPVDLLLQAVWYEVLPTSLILHAAALHDGPRAWLCAGPSGAGKSTLAQLFPNRSVADELVAVVGVDEAVGGPFELVALPFWSARPGRFSLPAVHCLEHHGQPGSHRRRRLTPRRAVAKLRGQVAWPTWDAAAMGRCLETLARLIETLPVYALAFSPQVDVWPWVVSDALGTDPELPDESTP